MRALAGVAAELGIGHRDRNRLRLRLLRFGYFEEATREGRLRRRAVRDHREIFRVVDLLVDAGAKETNEQLLLLNRDRHRGGDLSRSIAADNQVDLIDIE